MDAPLTTGAVDPKNTLYPITVLIDELKSDDKKQRINSVKSLQTISIALGHERTRNELLPYILDLMDDDEEILIEMAQILDGSYLQYVGGPLFAPYLFKPLERLCEVEEPTVREKAVASIKSIFEQVNVKDLRQQIIQMIERLMNGETYTSKLAAMELFPVIYLHLSQSHQRDIINLFMQTSQDEIPQVRKCASFVLNDMIKLIPHVPEADLFQIFGNFYQDEQDSVRMQGIDSCIHFARALPSSKINQHLTPYLKKFAVDKSWRIRYLVADKIMEITDAIGVENSREHLSSYYCQFLEDSESEVRTAAVRRLAEYGAVLDSKMLIQTVIPSLNKLQTDQFTYVRQALAENILSICPIIEKGPTNDHILPIFLALLRDESSDVRLNLFKRLEALNQVIGLENLQQSIVPALKDLGEDKNWRIKLSVVEQYPALAKQLGEPFFTEKLVGFCLNWLNDSVYSIRIAAIENFRELTKIFGSAWCERHVLKKLLEQRMETNYLHRLTCLFGIAELSEVVTLQIVKKSFIPVLQMLSKDKIPNIRMNVAKAIHKIRRKLYSGPVTQVESQLDQELLGILNELKQDEDDDVKFFSRKALNNEMNVPI